MMMMVVEKEDLGLNLGLSLSSSQAKTAATVSDHRVSDDCNFSSPPLMAPFSNYFSRSAHWSQTPLFSDGRVSFAKMGIDVNCAPEEMEADDGGACSPNSTICSSSGKRSGGEEEYLRQVDGDRTCSRGSSDEDEDGADHNTRRNNSNKKLRLSKDQAAVLEETFRGHNTLNPKQKMVLAKRLGLRPRQVEVWFQNRRARTKLKQTEVDCEYLRRCCDALSEENRRLQKELHQLKALKLSHHRLYTHMPPTTLTMCPSCERTGTARPLATARQWNVPPPPLQSSMH